MVGTTHTPGSSDTQLHMDDNQHATQAHRDDEEHSDEPVYAQSPGVLARLEHFTWVSDSVSSHPLRSPYSEAHKILPIVLRRIDLQNSDADNCH